MGNIQIALVDFIAIPRLCVLHAYYCI